MFVDDRTKVILLPNNDQVSNYKVVKFPVNLKENKFKSFLIQDDQMYELIEITGQNPYISTQGPLLKNNTSVKSFIFEGDTSGSVLQKPNLIVSSKFNLVYILIPILANNESMLKRYVSFEDITDTLMSTFSSNSNWISEVPDNLMLSSLKHICECITENGEEFFKFSSPKTFSFIDKKIQSLAKFIQETENSIHKKIDAQLQDSGANSESPPKEMMNLLAIKFALDTVCGEYITGELRQDLIEFNNYNFDALDNYLKELEIKNKDLKVVEKNMRDISSAATKSKNNKTEVKKKVKKEVKKVAVGKGALDSFFKKA